MSQANNASNTQPEAATSVGEQIQLGTGTGLRKKKKPSAGPDQKKLLEKGK